ncbi:MAG: SET domain-containing protein [Paracoccaceae bacterium]|nr:SET domain-containing protein [Paracoccaceae bacterium]MDG2257638.1 SET domain-containing protein [Paracoccaceae bacterium]
MNKVADGFCYSYVVKETSDKGLGVFAEVDIKQGSIVWRHVPGLYKVFNESAFNKPIADMTREEIVYELTHVFGLPEFPNCVIRVFDPGVLFNHSSDHSLITNNATPLENPLDETSPNYTDAVTKALLDDRYAMVATRDIKAGEEFTNNYALEVSDPPFFEAIYDQYDIDDGYVDSD